MSAHLNLARTQIFIRLRNQTSSSTAIKTVFSLFSLWFHFQPNYHFLKQSLTISSEWQDDRLQKYFCLSPEGPGLEAGASWQQTGWDPSCPPFSSFFPLKDLELSAVPGPSGRDPPPQDQVSWHHAGRQGWWDRPEHKTWSTRAGLLQPLLSIGYADTLPLPFTCYTKP